MRASKKLACVAAAWSVFALVALLAPPLAAQFSSVSNRIVFYWVETELPDGSLRAFSVRGDGRADLVTQNLGSTSVQSYELTPGRMAALWKILADSRLPAWDGEALASRRKAAAPGHRPGQPPSKQARIFFWQKDSQEIKEILVTDPQLLAKDFPDILEYRAFGQLSTWIEQLSRDTESISKPAPDLPRTAFPTSPAPFLTFKVGHYRPSPVVEFFSNGRVKIRQERRDGIVVWQNEQNVPETTVLRLKELIDTLLLRYDATEVKAKMLTLGRGVEVHRADAAQIQLDIDLIDASTAEVLSKEINVPQGLGKHYPAIAEFQAIEEIFKLAYDLYGPLAREKRQ